VAQVGPQVQVDLHQGTQELKERLQKVPALKTVFALERSWQPSLGSVVHISTLQGQWEMRNPNVNDRGWMSGDVFRLVLNIYQGSIGKMLNMELPTNPKLLITADGKTEMNMDLRWGSRSDTVTLRGHLTALAPNKLSDMPRAITSAALKVTLPALQAARRVRVTYFDGELLILRDDRDFIDIFWRTHQEGSSASVGSAKTRHEDSSDEDRQQPSVHEVVLGEQVGELHAKVEVLKKSLEAQRLQAEQARTESQGLRAEIARLEKDAESATVNAQSHIMKLDVMDSLTNKLSEETGAQQHKSSEKGQKQAGLQTELASLQAQAVDTVEKLRKLVIHEESLRDQIQVLEQQLRTGPRDSWQGYRAAIARAKSELTEVKDQFSAAQKTSRTLKRHIAKTEGELRKCTGETDDEAALRKQLEDQLEMHEREIVGERALLSEAVVEREALSAELGEVRSKLAELEASEAEGREQAVAVEAELEDIILQAKEAQKFGKSMKEGKDRSQRRWFR
jgi:hypothetical protein